MNLTAAQRRQAAGYRAQIAKAAWMLKAGRWTPAEAANHRECYSALLDALLNQVENPA